MTASHLLLLLAAAIAQTPAPSATTSIPGPTQTKTADSTAPLRTGPAVLRIDGQEVSGDEYGEWLLKSQGESLAREYGLDYWVVDREAKRHGIDVSEAEIGALVQGDFKSRIANAFLGRKSEWLAELERTGRSEGGLTRQRMVETKPLLQSKALASIDRVVPEEKIVREWQLHYGRHGKHYDLAMIKLKVVVPTYPDATRDQWEAERKRRMDEQRDMALKIRERALRGEDFGKLAREYSTDPDTRDNRGVPSGGFSHFGWPDVFLDALEALKPGEISEPVYARGGYWLVKLRAVHETPLEDVRGLLLADLVARGPESDEIGALQARIAEGVKVEILPTLYEVEPSGEWPPAFEPVLEVDGEPVRRGDYARWILHTRGESLARQFTEEWIVSKRARELGITVDESEVKARTATFVQWLIDSGYKGSRESWVAFLELGGRNESSYLRGIDWRMRIDLMAEKMMMRERTVSSEQVRALWRDTYGEEGREITARMIQIRNDISGADPKWTRAELAKHMDAASRRARAKAEELVKRARAGDDFAALARSESSDPDTSERGGELTERFRPEMWSDEVASAVKALAPGEISEALEVSGAWVVFQVTGLRTVAFDDVKDALEHELMTRKPTSAEIAHYKNSLSKAAKLELLPPMYE